jgi:hypothetical protein
MYYQRPPYLSPDIPLQKIRPKFSNASFDVPKIHYPITALENFKRSAAHSNPLWVPNLLTDFQSLSADDLYIDEKTDGVSRDLSKNHVYKDWFGVDWTWVAEAHGPMLTPGTQYLDDITNWEKNVKFPTFRISTGIPRQNIL